MGKQAPPAPVVLALVGLLAAMGLLTLATAAWSLAPTHTVHQLPVPILILGDAPGAKILQRAGQGADTGPRLPPAAGAAVLPSTSTRSNQPAAPRAPTGPQQKHGPRQKHQHQPPPPAPPRKGALSFSDPADEVEVAGGFSVSWEPPGAKRPSLERKW